MGKKIILIFLFFIVLLMTIAVGRPRFVVQGEKERNKALGSLEGLPENLRKAFSPDEDFIPLEKPQAGDWLAMFPEQGQGFDLFVRSGFNSFKIPRNCLYFQPLGEFKPEKSPSIELLAEFARTFFSAKVTVLPNLDLKNGQFTSRINSQSGQNQILTGDILKFLRQKIPDDAYCVIALTMTDLYAGSGWNFVFGEATLEERVGVFSFARYDPEFYGEKRGSDYMKIILKRSCRVLAHEVAHMFGMLHCIYFKCLENGSNHLAESDSRPLHFCPVCLRKFHYAIGFDVVERYKRLLEFYRKVGFTEEVEWLEKRLRKLLP